MAEGQVEVPKDKAAETLKLKDGKSLTGNQQVDRMTKDNKNSSKKDTDADTSKSKPVDKDKIEKDNTENGNSINQSNNEPVEKKNKEEIVSREKKGVSGDKRNKTGDSKDKVRHEKIDPSKDQSPETINAVDPFKKIESKKREKPEAKTISEIDEIKKELIFDDKPLPDEQTPEKAFQKAKDFLLQTDEGKRLLDLIDKGDVIVKNVPAKEGAHSVGNKIFIPADKNVGKNLLAIAHEIYHVEYHKKHEAEFNKSNMTEAEFVEVFRKEEAEVTVKEFNLKEKYQDKLGKKFKPINSFDAELGKAPKEERLKIANDKILNEHPSGKSASVTYEKMFKENYKKYKTWK